MTCVTRYQLSCVSWRAERGGVSSPIGLLWDQWWSSTETDCVAVRRAEEPTGIRTDSHAKVSWSTMCFFFHCISFSVGPLPPLFPSPTVVVGIRMVNVADNHHCVPYIFDSEPIICNSQKRQLLNTTDMRWKSKGSLNLQGTNFYK